MSVPTLIRYAVIALLGALAGSCTPDQSALHPRGPQAELLADIIWFFVIACTAVWIAVVIALAMALLRRRGPRPDPLAADPQRERRAHIAIGAAVVATFLIVTVHVAVSYVGQKRLFTHKEPAVTITVTGHQWWWEVRYEDPRPHHVFTTANEIHVPVGEPVTVVLKSDDVIHSFWVPNLAGKVDLIPGQDNRLQFVAAREGVYRGQCAEFCGFQHAHMGLVVVAEPRESFEQWRAAQIKPANPPSDPERQKGHDVFHAKACMMCHQIRGAPAGGRMGPDLTHLASRRDLAAATLKNTRGNLAAWIVDPQSIKPGSQMPLVSIAPDELDPLLSYLEGLK
jgi:cytochrome c oxidase subunit II